MPLNVRRFCTSILLVFTFSFIISAQTAPSSADIMRERVAKAKAYIAVKNYNAGIYELENIRRETSDPTVHSVINVLLMNSYLEQGDYKRAQDFLKDVSSPQKINRQNGAASYFAVAGQVIKGARTQLERYKSLGLSVSDRNLPVDAAVDVQKMRETLETVVAQSKILGADKKQTPDAMALIEEATSARSNLAKDGYDAKRWKDEAADAREQLANSRSVIVNAAGEPTSEMPMSNAAMATNLPANNQSSTNQNPTAPLSPQVAPVFQPVQGSSGNAVNQTPVANNISQPANDAARIVEEKKPVEAPKTIAETVENKIPQTRSRRVENTNAGTTSNQADNASSAPVSAAAPKSDAPLAVGSLVDFATQKSNPVYPPAARSMRASGIVRVELMVDENGQVAEVQKTSGPALLQRAATDAVKKWKFKPFVRDGEPVRATGFVSFNFSL
ncbi:MAG TPA: TonB family protein [Pyrinomonadaceae bacterium]|nr:TonB family protein [Pyrinomonadaceae bacterium]